MATPQTPSPPDTTTLPTPSPTKPTIILVSGAWHLPPHYAPLRTLLTHAGYPVSTPPNPSANSPPHDSRVQDDITALHTHLRALLAAGHRRLVPVLHSYGGIVGSHAVADLPRASPDGATPGILAVLYLAAFALAPDATLAATVSDPAPPEWVAPDEAGYLRTTNELSIFYHDLPPAQAAEQLAQLATMPACILFAAGPEPEVWRRFPMGYVMAEMDRCIPVKAQEGMVRRVREMVGGEQQLRTWRVPCGHMVQLVRPEVVVEIVGELVEGVVGSRGA